MLMQKQNKDSTKEKKPDPAASGLFIAAWFSVVGILLFYTPVYIGINGWVEKLINIGGWITIIISIIGAIVEFSTIFKHKFPAVFKNDGFSYLGTSLVLFIPGIVLHLFQKKYLVNQIEIIFIKSLVIIFLIIGFGLFLYGISFLLEKKVDNEKMVNEVAATIETKKDNVKLGVSIIITILSLVTAILKLISVLLN